MSGRSQIGRCLMLLPVCVGVQVIAAEHPSTATKADKPVVDVRVALSDGEVQLVVRDEWWFDPSAVERIELRLNALDATDVRGRFDTRNWNFRRKEGDRFDLTMHEGVRSDWRQTTEMRIEYGDKADWHTAAILMARPAKLDFHGCCAPMLMLQRSTAEVPGSAGYLTIRLDDITRGQVVLTLRTADGWRLVDDKSVRAGDAYEFKLGEKQYTLYVEQLDNQLLGPDSATLEVSRLPAAELQQIWWLLSRVRKADAVFVRNGHDYTGVEAAKHLRDKLWGESHVATCDDFIDNVASRSSLSGTPYSVRLHDGKSVAASEWLRDQLSMKTDAK